MVRELFVGTAAHFCHSVRSPALSPQPPPRMVPAVILFLLLLVEQAGKWKARVSVGWARVGI